MFSTSYETVELQKNQDAHIRLGDHTENFVDTEELFCSTGGGIYRFALPLVYSGKKSKPSRTSLTLPSPRCFA